MRADEASSSIPEMTVVLHGPEYHTFHTAIFIHVTLYYTAKNTA